MKVIATLFRVSPFPTANLIANIPKGDPSDLMGRITTRFGPLAPRFKIFVQDNKKSYAGMEVMSFDVKAENLPHAALVLADPISPEEINRVDGGLRSEMERLGIDQSRFDDHHWRMEVQVKGN